MEKIEEIKEIERLSKVIDDVMNESDLFNKTLLEVTDRLGNLMVHSKVGGYTVESLFNEANEIFKFIEERYNELPYCNNGDYFHDMLSKLQQDKHEARMKKIKEDKKKKIIKK